MQHNKLIRLADQGGPTEEREKKWTLFPAVAAKPVQLSLYNKKLGKFETMTLEEAMNKKIDMKKKPSTVNTVGMKPLEFLTLAV